MAEHLIPALTSSLILKQSRLTNFLADRCCIIAFRP